MKVLILLSIFVVLALSYPHTPGFNDEEEYYNVLALTWPKTMCKKHEATYPDSTAFCNDERFNRLIIHNLWQNWKDDGTYINNCEGDEFEMDEIDFIKRDLEMYWPSLFDSNEQKWRSSWDKHGTCYAYYLSEEIPMSYYFEEGLALYKKYAPQLTSMIIEQLGHGLSLSQLLNEIQNIVGSRGRVSCSQGKNLEQVLLCFDEDSNIIDCPHKLGSGCRGNIVIPQSEGLQHAFASRRRGGRSRSGENCDATFSALIMEYQPVFCTTTGCNSNVKNQPDPYRFNIHGLWPQCEKGYPANCPGKFNNPDQLLEELSQETINKVTPIWSANSKRMDTEGKFWKYEYNKHGTCFLKYFENVADTVDDYFSKAGNFHNAYDIGEKVLAKFKSGKNLYKFDEIKKYVDATVGKETLLFCNRKNGRNLQGICLCMGRYGELIDCPDVSYCRLESCEDEVMLIHPPFSEWK